MTEAGKDSLVCALKEMIAVERAVQAMTGFCDVVETGIERHWREEKEQHGQ